MGWTFYPTNRDARQEVESLFEYNEIVHISKRGNIFYVAAKVEDAVKAFVVLTSRSNQEFGYKVMSEDFGPYYFGAPAILINKLSPTENEYAKEWRAKCLNDKTKKIGVGDKVTFPVRLNYKGFTVQTFEKVDMSPRRNIFITVDARDKDDNPVENTFVRIPKINAYEGVLVNGKEV